VAQLQPPTEPFTADLIGRNILAKIRVQIKKQPPTYEVRWEFGRLARFYSPDPADKAHHSARFGRLYNFDVDFPILGGKVGMMLEVHGKTTHYIEPGANATEAPEGRWIFMTEVSL
jgi:hypothetical protein